MAKVTIGVAVYNVQKYIKTCVESLLVQTLSDLEILLVDDGSTDSSGSICDAYAAKDSRIRVIHQKNSGLSDVRNVIVREASCEYLLFVDGDDSVGPEFADLSVKAMESEHLDLAVFDYLEVEEETENTERHSEALIQNKVLNAKEEPRLLTIAPTTWNKIYRTAFLRKTGLVYPVGRNYEDLSVTLRLLIRAERVMYLDIDPQYRYMLRDGSIMRNHNFKKNYEQRRKAAQDILRDFETQKLRESYENELEYMIATRLFFEPSKEILRYEPHSPYLKKFRAYAYREFPHLSHNPYVRMNYSRKDKILFFLIVHRLYPVERILTGFSRFLRTRKA